MNRSEINKAVTNLRINYQKEYKEIVRNLDQEIHPYLKAKLEAAGFSSYEQVKKVCPRGYQLGYFIIEILRS